MNCIIIEKPCQKSNSPGFLSPRALVEVRVWKEGMARLALSLKDKLHNWHFY